ncbi:MAG: M14 family metallopeptidase [Sciscionella sp.]
MGVLLAATAGLALIAPSASFAGPPTSGSAAAKLATDQQPTAPARGVYAVHGADTVAERTRIADSGVDLLSADRTGLRVIATPRQADALRAAGFRLISQGGLDALLAARSGRGTNRPQRAGDFPAGDEAYHTYAEATAELRQTVAEHPDIAMMLRIGKSYQGRDMNVIKISDNAATDEDEPEVLFTCNQHAREHLTTEMCLHLVKRFTDGYGNDPAVTDIVNSHEIYLIPNMNPDGSEFDISGGKYHAWRKNRQPNADSSAIGTDLNRNWGYKWGCCNGSSTSPANETYRGSSAFSAPETKAVADFVDSRVVGGVQQIKATIDFHTYSELVLWPFGYTTSRTADGLDAEQAARFEDIGRRMAATNGYTPEQSSALYITDGDITDWAWGANRILSFAFEMYPTENGAEGFYPPASVIGEQTRRNDAAADLLLHEVG